MNARIDYSKYGAKPDDEIDYSKYGAIPEDDNSLLSKAGNIAGGFNEAVESSQLPSLAGGFLQGAGDVGASLANVPLSLISKITGKNVNIAHPDLGQYLPKDDLSKLAFGGGEIGSMVPAFMSGAGIASQGELASKMAELGRLPGLIGKSIEGAGTGAAIGENDQGNRTAATVLGGVAEPVIAGVSKLASPFVNAFRDLSPFQKDVESKTENLSNLQSNLDQYFQPKATHDVNVAQRVNNIVNGKKSEIGSMYDQVESDLANKNITIQNTDDISDLHDQLRSLLRSNQKDSPEAKDILDRMDNINKNTEIPARDYLSQFRTLRDYARDSRSQQYKIGITDEARMAAKQRADELEDKVEQMKPILEDALGPENNAVLKQANQRYASEIAPLNRNNVYNNFRFNGRGPANIIKDLRGTGTGASQLREIIQNDPEALRNALGQRYAANPQNIHNANDLVQDYIDKSPDLNSFIDKHSDLTEKLNQSVSNLENMKKTQASARNTLLTGGKTIGLGSLGYLAGKVLSRPSSPAQGE